MTHIRVVVDSAVDFHSEVIPQRYRITLVPQTIQFADTAFLEVEEMNAEAFYERMSHTDEAFTVQAPTVEQFKSAYKNLARYTDQIISLHTSQHLSKAYHHAQIAAENFRGRCNIVVLDSRTTSAGLGLLAEHTAQIAAESNTMEDVVHVVHGAIERTYGVFYVNTLGMIQKNGLLGEAQAVLGTMLGIKPFLTIEEGELMTMEKVRTRAQAVDKLVEFVTEFENIHRLAIVQNSPFTTDAVRSLQDRLGAELMHKAFPTVLYGPTLGSFLGFDAVGVAVLENEFI